MAQRYPLASLRHNQEVHDAFTEALPLIEPVWVSVTVSVCVPLLLKITVKVCTPASAATNVSAQNAPGAADGLRQQSMTPFGWSPGGTEISSRMLVRRWVRM